jgi:hypothetical protein
MQHNCVCVSGAGGESQRESRSLTERRKFTGEVGLRLGGTGHFSFWCELEGRPLRMFLPLFIPIPDEMAD